MHLVKGSKCYSAENAFFQQENYTENQEKKRSGLLFTNI